MRTTHKTGWTYYMCPLETDPAAFLHFAGIVEIWRNKRAPGEALPDRRAFDFYDFVGWHGQVFLARFDEAPFNVTFSLWGTVLTEWWGCDYTNKHLGEQSTEPDVWAETELAYFRKMRETPFIGISGGTLAQHRRPNRHVVAVDLPMRSETGGVAHVAGIHSLAEDGNIKDLFPGLEMTCFLENR
ncbi:MAG: hypothetical protein NXI16_08985 [Alphaproteobacteria bacterium]|nr:hypothetical protein [Alphaproteobacteria bacterium]